MNTILSRMTIVQDALKKERNHDEQGTRNTHLQRMRKKTTTRRGEQMTTYGVVGNQKGWDWEWIKDALKHLITSKEDKIISGGAEGTDTIAQDFAKELGITITIHYPDNNKPSPERYFIRNEQIAKECEVLIAFDKKSGAAGTKNTVAHAKKLGKKIILYKEETY